MYKKDFYRDCFAQTGWLPMQPLTQPVAVGDVCQLLQGRLQPLLNLEQAHLVAPLHTSAPVPLAPIDWSVARGVTQAASESHWSDAGDDEQRLWKRQVLEFSQAGDFLFYGREARARLLRNWNHVRTDATVKLTQTHFGFHDVYVVTGIARTDEWGLAVAGQAGARLEMSAASDDFNWHALLGDTSARTERSEGMASYDVGRGQPAYFFKAKKLVLSDKMHDHYLNRLFDEEVHERHVDIASWSRASLLNLVRTNELSLTTCAEFFTWVDMSLDDVERLAG
jgi:hypothetical protein